MSVLMIARLLGDPCRKMVEKVAKTEQEEGGQDA